jgi:preprotein translocase subunit SecD
MISNNARLLLVIILSVGMAVFFLGSNQLNIIIGGSPSEREVSGPLGLKLGLDLQGGVHLIYEAEGESPTKSQMEGVLNIIERRVNAFGVAEPSIQLMGTNRLLIQLPGVENIEEAKRLIGRTAQLEFKERDCLDPSCSQFEDQDIGLTGELLESAYWSRDNTTGKPIVNLKFNSKGASIFADTTTRIAGSGDRIAIFLDDEEMLAPVAQNAIFGGEAIITGDFTVERVQTIAIQLESGRLPVPIRVIQENDVDATLGTDALQKSLQAGYIGFGLVILFMILYYRIPGFISALALISYVALVLAIFKLIPITLTLAGIAGFILSVGMAVDANILIFERMKEELRTGRTLLASIDMGFNRAWPSIRDSNVSTFITCGILFWFGSRFGASLVTGFAVSLFIGVAVSMFSAIMISKTLLRIFGSTPIGKHTKLFSPVPGPSGPGRIIQSKSRT